MTSEASPPITVLSSLAQNNLTTPHILVVDNQIHALKDLIFLLGDYDIRLFKAQDGKTALHTLRTETIDLLLLEISLPDMSGLDVMDFIKKQGYDTHTIVLSESTDINAPIEALKRGAFSYLRKPSSTEELLSSIKNVLDARALESRHQQMAWQLECSEKMYRNLVDNAPDIIFTISHDGTITYINQRVTTILGYPPSELIGKPYSTLISNDDLNRAQALFSSKYKSTRHIELSLKSEAEKESYPFSLTIMNMTFNPANPDSMEKTGSAYIIARDLSEKKRAAEIISYHKNYDLLTGLPNRTLLTQQIDTELQRLREANGGMTILFVDLDRFKLINDTMGHLSGDLLLQQAGMRLKELVRTGDIVSRLGSDEFLIALPGLKDAGRIQTIATQCLDTIQQPFSLDNEENVQITASIGIATYPEHGLSAVELIANADIAMYQVKIKSKNDFCFYEDSMIRSSHAKISLEQEMRRALDRNQLEMYYQPQVDIATGEIIGAEALMRWNHPERGLLSAGEFLPYAEEIGLIAPYTDWMLGSVCRDILAARVAGCKLVPVSVNMSPQYLDREDCIDKMKDVFSHYRIQDGMIGVEITENISIRNPHQAIELLGRLNHLGVDIAIDDFGIGYSSLAYLRKFPIQTIKIDRSFVSEIHHDMSEFPVILAIISIAKGLGMKLIAEGVETEIQAAYLKNWGCHIMQGHLYHRPMPIQNIISILAGESVQQSG
ncbi:EAL domain-containing protein [Oxalobacter vibrioformis]|uniref:EAL domain-containing protein n=1 Tax=Oxalobacter vibrioformis TaxID=933080 RepID=A0A9E9LWA8_9BURK|nr:EAL domain-containing protein [Oxalobacter vibrioformis]WAW09461.1 EAL domain-containing protein [Oxalobacter vibrioformis]